MPWTGSGRGGRVIVTSGIFRDGALGVGSLRKWWRRWGRERLVLDLSCRKRGDDYFVVTDRWQKFTDLRLGPEVLPGWRPHVPEFLVHAVDVEGLLPGH